MAGHQHGFQVAGGEWRDYRYLPDRYKTSVGALNSLFSSRMFTDHQGPAEHLDVGIDWDGDVIRLQGRDAARSAMYGLKWVLSCVEVKPMMYRMRDMDSKRTQLDLLVETSLSPHRPWWLPASWLLPKTVTLQGEEHIRISKGAAENGSHDVITRFDTKLHNIGKLLPEPFRMLNGAIFGYLPLATEPLWRPFAALFGDSSLRPPGQPLFDKAGQVIQSAKEKAAGLVNPAMYAEGTEGAVISGATGVTAGVDKLASGAEYAAQRAEEVAGGRDGGIMGKAAGAVRDTVAGAAGGIREGVTAVGSKAVGMAGDARRAVAGKAY